MHWGFAVDEERRKLIPEFFFLFLVNKHISPGAERRRCRGVYRRRLWGEELI